MITFITHMRVSAENTETFVAAMDEMTRNVREHEPGVIFYGLSRSDEDPDTFMVIEIYRDEAAFKAHWKTDYIRPLLARTKPLVEGEAFDIKKYVSA